jgi:N-acetylneuraminate synthase
LNLFSIAGRTIGPGNPCFVIAEACDNHLGRLDIALEMCHRAKAAGADCVKFQHHLPSEEMLPDVPMSANFEIPLFEFLQRYSLSLADHEQLLACCKSIGIQYLCTPFSYKAALELASIGVAALKIGSGEMTDIPSLTRMARELRLPMIVSTGMSTYPEIDRTYRALIETGVPLALTYCVSEYPPVYEDMNLRNIPEMTRRYPDAVIGHSDHTPDLFTCYAAVTLGAAIIEKHVIIDRNQPGPDQAVSIEFSELTELTEGIRKIEASLGDQKTVHERERSIRAWAFRSVVSTRSIRAGEALAHDALWSKRPGTGIPAHLMDTLIGRKAARDIEANVLIKWEDLEPSSPA